MAFGLVWLSNWKPWKRISQDRWHIAKTLDFPSQQRHLYEINEAKPVCNICNSMISNDTIGELAVSMERKMTVVILIP